MNESDLDEIANGNPCPRCGAEPHPVVDEDPPDDPDDEEGGWAMTHDLDCPLLEMIDEQIASVPDEVFAGTEGGAA